MRNIHLLALVIYITSSTVNNKTENAQISLNGNWKFNAIYGEGSNYLNIQETASDIVIDNDDQNVAIHGDWRTLNVGARNTKFYGKDYLEHHFTLTDLKDANKTDSSYVRFYPNFKKNRIS